MMMRIAKKTYSKTKSSLTRLWEYFEVLLDKYAWTKEQLEIEKIWDFANDQMVRRAQNFKPKELRQTIGDLLEHPVVKNERRQFHHYNHARLDHMMLVSQLAFYFAHKLNSNPWNCARAGILHDVNARWYQTKKAAGFARRLGENEIIQSAIETHMFMSRIPQYREGWIICLADFIAAWYEIQWSARCIYKDVTFQIMHKIVNVYNLRYVIN